MAISDTDWIVAGATAGTLVAASAGAWVQYLQHSLTRSKSLPRIEPDLQWHTDRTGRACVRARLHVVMHWPASPRF